MTSSTLFPYITRSDGLFHNRKVDHAYTFYNDPKTENNHFSVVVHNPGRAVAYLRPFLTFEDGEHVADQTILREIKPPAAYAASCETVIKFRIEKVSRWCEGKKFVLEFTFGTGRTATSERMAPILVQAKNPDKEARRKARKAENDQNKTSSKRARATGGPCSNGKKARGSSRDLHRDIWDKQVCLLMTQSCWEVCGFEKTFMDTVACPNPKAPIYKCKFCQVTSFASDRKPHGEECRVRQLLESCHSLTPRHQDLCAPHPPAQIGCRAGALAPIKSESGGLLDSQDPAYCPPSPSRSNSLDLALAGLGAPPSPGRAVSNDLAENLESISAQFSMDELEAFAGSIVGSKV